MQALVDLTGIYSLPVGKGANHVDRDCCVMTISVLPHPLTCRLLFRSSPSGSSFSYSTSYGEKNITR